MSANGAAVVWPKRERTRSGSRCGRRGVQPIRADDGVVEEKRGSLGRCIGGLDKSVGFGIAVFGSLLSGS